MKENTIKIRKLFYSYMKEKVWLEEKALEGLKLCNITLGCIFEFEKIEPAKLVYEIERFDLPTNPSLSDIHQKEQFIDMATETGWEVVTWDEALTYYLCKPYSEQDSNALYNDEESRQLRAARFRSIYVNLGHSLLGYSLTLNLIMLFLAVLADFNIQRGFEKFYLVFTLLYTIFCIGLQYLYRKMGNDMYRELCMSPEEWKQKYDYSKENVKKCKKIIVRGKALVNYLNRQAQEGWYLSSVHMFSYTFTRENAYEQAPVYYAIENRMSIRKRLKQTGQSLERNRKDLNNLGCEWLEQSAKAAMNAGLQYICTFDKRFIVYTTTDSATARDFQNSGIAVGWMSYGIVWFILACGLCGGIIGFLVGFLGL